MKEAQNPLISGLQRRLVEINEEIRLTKRVLWAVQTEKGGRVVTLRITGEQFEDFQRRLEEEQSVDPNRNVQVFIESNSETASGGFGFVFDPYAVPLSEEVKTEMPATILT